MSVKNQVALMQQKQEIEEMKKKQLKFINSVNVKTDFLEYSYSGYSITCPACFIRLSLIIV